MRMRKMSMGATAPEVEKLRDTVVRTVNRLADKRERLERELAEVDSALDQLKPIALEIIGDDPPA